MKNKNVKGLLVVVAVVAVAFGVYHFTHRTKTFYARTIVKLGGATSFITLLTYDEDYLKAWAKALIKGQQTFDVGGKTYHSAGGTVVQ